jgi:hypothetical protein
MGIDPQERLAKSYKASNIQNGIWCELMKLHTINEKKPTKELVGRKGKTAQKKGKKHHPKTAFRFGYPFGAREDDLIVIGDEAISLGLLQILLREHRRHPAGRGVRSLPLGHLVLLRHMLHAHLRFAHGGYAGDQRCAKIATMVVAVEAMNW